jgi:hypothetical protein
MGSTAQYDPEEPLLEEEIEEERQQIIVVTLKALIMEFIGSAILASAAFMALRPGSGLGGKFRSTIMNVVPHAVLSHPQLVLMIFLH